MKDYKELNVFKFIDYIFEKYKKIHKSILDCRKYINSDFVNEYIHLITNVIYDLNNLYAHSPEEPNADTLEEDYYSCLESTTKLNNFICFICNGMSDDELYSKYQDICYRINFYYYDRIKGITVEEIEEMSSEVFYGIDEK